MTSPSDAPPDPHRDNVELAFAVRELARVADALQQAEQRYRLLIEGLEDGVVIVGATGRLEAFNAAALHILGGDEPALRGWVQGEPQPAAAGMPQPQLHPAMAALRDGNEQIGVEIEHPAFEGGDRWLSVSARPVRDPQTGALQSVVCSFSDITARRTRHAELERQVTVDPLTGLFNRRYLELRLDAEVSRARRSHRPLTLAIADVDHFKRVNDRHGHGGGDRALRSFADALRATLRIEDIVARLGGDEFCMLFPGTHAATAAFALERVLARLRATDIEGDPEPFRISGTCGLTELSPGQSASELMASADAALYAAKSAGRDRVAIQR